MDNDTVKVANEPPSGKSVVVIILTRRTDSGDFPSFEMFEPEMENGILTDKSRKFIASCLNIYTTVSNPLASIAKLLDNIFP